MSWQTILPTRGCVAGRQMAPVMVGMTKGGKMRLTITTDEAEKVGWKVGTKLAPMHGIGEHAGKLRVAVEPGGFSLGLAQKKSKRLDILWPAPAGVEVAKRIPAAVQIRLVAHMAGCIELALPEWAVPAAKPAVRGFQDHPKALPAQPVAKRIA